MRLPRATADLSFVSVLARSAVNTNANKIGGAGLEAIGLFAKPLLGLHRLGRPSVGGRLTAGAAGRISSRHGRPDVLSVKCQQVAHCRLARQLYRSAVRRVRLRGLCALGSGSTLRLRTCSPAALHSAPVLRHLTLPSSGRA